MRILSLVLVMLMTTSTDLFQSMLPLMRQNFGAFFSVMAPARSYKVGRHTKEIIRQCQLATNAIERGENYYVIVNVPPRHGKSDAVSRRYPVWHIARNPEHEAILASYSALLAEELNLDAMKCMKAFAPHVGLKLDRKRADFWTLDGHKGRVNAVGLGGSMTGKGAHVFVIDDYIKNREEAESKTIRDKIWDGFRNDVATRLSPEGHAVIIVATRWHEDDLVGRIIKAEKEDPEFPRFRKVVFAAESESGEWLFPERFSDRQYRSMKAITGTYAWNALYQQQPTARYGNMLRADRVQYIDYSELPAGLSLHRGWDLASSEKERISEDPDYTVGTLAGYSAKPRRNSTGFEFPPYSAFVVDVSRGQWTALKRNERMVAAAEKDGPNVKVYIESVGGYKDTYETIRSNLKGRSVVKKSTVQGDKVARASLLEPAFEAGQVYVVRAPWNKDWVAEFNSFPKGSHDDQVDSLGLALHEDLTRNTPTIGKV